jgi:hypothetical protein
VWVNFKELLDSKNFSQRERISAEFNCYSLALLFFLLFCFNFAAVTTAAAAFIASGWSSRKSSADFYTCLVICSIDLPALLMFFNGPLIIDTVFVISSIRRDARITVYEIATAIMANEEAAIIVAIPPGPILGRIPDQAVTI